MNLFADGVAVAQKIVNDVVTHNDIVRGLLVVDGGKSPAQDNIDVIERDHRPGKASHVGI